MIYEHLYAKCNSEDGKSSIWATAGYSMELPKDLIRHLERLCHFEIDPTALDPECVVRFLPLTPEWFALTFITTMPNGNTIDSRPSAVFHSYLFGREDAMILFADINALKRLFYLPHITNFPAGATFTPSHVDPSTLLIQATPPITDANVSKSTHEELLHDLFLQAIVCESQTKTPGILLIADDTDFDCRAEQIVHCLLKLPTALRIVCGFHTCCRVTSELFGLRMAFCSGETLIQFRDSRFNGAPAAQWMLYAPKIQVIHSDSSNRVTSAARRLCACHTAEDFAIINRLLTSNPQTDGTTLTLYIQAFMQWQDGGMPDNVLTKAPATLPLDWLAARCKTTGDVCILFLYALELGTPNGKKLADSCSARLGENALPVLLDECTDPQQENKILAYFQMQKPALDPTTEKAEKAIHITSICMGIGIAILLAMIILFAMQWYAAKLSFFKVVWEAVKLLFVISTSVSIGLFYSLRSHYQKRLSRYQNSHD